MSKPIVSDPEILSGTPVFLGTRIPLEHVVGLIRNGSSEAELLEDFPSLDNEDLEYAREYARQHEASAPKPLKPLKLRRTTKVA